MRRKEAAQEAPKIIVIHMTKFDIKEFAMTAVVPAVAINAAGAVEPMLDNAVNKYIPFISSNAAVNKNAKYAKYMKAGLYTLIGLGVQGAAMTMKSNKTIDAAADAVSLFAYGLSGATLAEDPVFNVPNPQYQSPGQVAAAPARQVVVRTGNVIS